jgi:hypothetical protein
VTIGIGTATATLNLATLLWDGSPTGAAPTAANIGNAIFKPGFSMMTVGNATQTGAITVNSLVTDNLVITSPLTIQTSVASVYRLNLYGNIKDAYTTLGASYASASFTTLGYTATTSNNFYSIAIHSRS